MIFDVNFEDFFNLASGATPVPFRDALNFTFQIDRQADEKVGASIWHRFTF